MRQPQVLRLANGATESSLTTQMGTNTPVFYLRGNSRLSNYAIKQQVKKILGGRNVSTSSRGRPLPQGRVAPVTKRPVEARNQTSSPSFNSSTPSNSPPKTLQLRLESDVKTPLHVTVSENKAFVLIRFVGTTLLLLGVLYFISGRGGFPDVKPKLAERPNVRFSDVKGCEEVKSELEVIVKYLADPTFGRLGARIPSGVLLVGPPGTGKTLLAKAVAGEAQCNFYYVAGSSFDEVFVGVGEKRVRELFEEAKSKAPAIIFIDEIDAIAGRDNRFRYRPTSTIHQLLAALDGFEGREKVVVIAATNHPESLDKALVRPGRFDKQISVPLPDIKGRKEILDYYLNKVKAAPDVRTDLIAKATVGFSGADLANLINVAATKATLQGLDAITTATIDEAKDDIVLGPHAKSRVVHKEDVRITAYHEAGHALVAMYTPGATAPYKISILPRGMTGGTTQWVPEEDRQFMTKQQMKAQLATAMGGRIGEELKFGPDSITGGASNDFKQATQMATYMVAKLGMSEKVGHISIADEGQSPDGQRIVEEEAKKLVEEAYAHAKKVLQEHERELHILASGLLDYETLSKEEILALLAGKELPDSFYKQYTKKKVEEENKGDNSKIPLMRPSPRMV